jgi:type I restriction enzyme S subunit
MARGQKAKQKELTPEERLQNALVPKKEWPYELPEGWKWVYLIPGAAECLDGFRKPVNASERAERIGNIPYYGATGQVGYIDDYLTDEPLVLVGEDGAPFLDPFKEKAYLITGKAWVNNHAHILRSYYGDAGNRFLMHYLNVFDYRGHVNGTTRLKLTQSSMQTIPVPYPSEEVQEELVYFIDSEFQRLDEAKDKIQSVLDSSEERKQSILHKAFTGELTEKWRALSNKSCSDWQDITFDDIIQNIQAGKNVRCEERPPKEDEIGIVKVSAVTWGEYNEEESKTCLTNEFWNQEYEIHPEDFLFSRANTLELVGNCVIVKQTSKKLMLSDKILRITFKNEVDPYWLLYFTQSKEYRSQIEELSSGNQMSMRNVSQNNLRKVKVTIPLLEEQHEIVRILDKYFNSDKIVQYTASAALDQLEKTRKSILSKAFRGELIR